MASLIAGLLCTLFAGICLYTLLAKRSLLLAVLFGALSLCALDAWWQANPKHHGAATVPAPAMPVAVTLPTPLAHDAGIVADAAPAAKAEPPKVPQLQWCLESPTNHCVRNSCTAGKKPTLVLLSADWCGACAVLAMRIAFDDEMRHVMTRDYNLVKLDVDVNRKAARGYPSSTIPAAYILGSSCEILRELKGKITIIEYFEAVYTSERATPP